MVRRVEPALATAAATAMAEAQQLVGDLREPAQEVQYAGRDAVDDLRDETRQAAGEVRDGVSG